MKKARFEEAGFAVPRDAVKDVTREVTREATRAYCTP
jgi:hypothetical protein